MSSKIDRLISIAGVLVILVVPAFSGCVALAQQVQVVKTTEADHYVEIIERLRRIEDKIDHSRAP